MAKIMSDEPMYLACALVSEMEVPCHGAVVKECANCACKIWVSKSGQQYSKTDNTIFLCAKCAAKMVAEAEEVNLYENPFAEFEELNLN